ncbi:putative permease [Kibdelosporangium banguiense]|uniref:Permease n=1 Tax=Kibdelosporangium banguiense TaxID=1365924 RepID=A0ABS4TRP1_9PSEU|nr:hypothetical protein [Kibdelosporangium banguiense]MBP2327072.1 putative permease [Kibdelosporangium banguiense]
MWTIVIVTYAVALLALLLAAGWVALFVKDHRRATRATGILKIVLAATLGSGGLFGLLIRLHELGLL